MIFEKIRSMIAEKMDIPESEITLSSSFEDMKVDSLDMVEIVMELEETFDITIEDNDDMKNVGDLVAYIEKLQ